MNMHMPSLSDCISSSINQNVPSYHSLHPNKCFQICMSSASATVQFEIKHFSNKLPPFDLPRSLRRPFGTFSSTDTPKFGPKQGLNCSRMTNVCADGIHKLDEFVEVGNKLADVAGQVIRQYFRKNFDIVDKDDLSPVTIADRAAEEAMRSIISEYFPSHAIYGEEDGWTCKEKNAEYVWVLDPIDGTKSFITGKPLFGTLIALVHRGVPIVGIIDQPILRERWIGKIGEKTMLNGQEVSARSCGSLDRAYMYTTSPHLFSGQAEEAFTRVRNKVKVSLYGCDCYAYALLASGHVDLVIESGLKPYDFMALVPVVEGAGGVITDWKGQKLTWEFSSDGHFPSGFAGYNVVAAGDAHVHEAALTSLDWN